jgi:hypothetical protein
VQKPLKLGAFLIYASMEVFMDCLTVGVTRPVKRQVPQKTEAFPHEA